MAISKDTLRTLKAEYEALDKQIADLTKSRESIATFLKAHTTTAPKSDQPKQRKAASTKAAPSEAGKHKGFISLLLPFMFERTEVAASAMLDYLKAQPGLSAIKRNSLDATLQNELKKGAKARVARVKPGIYKITEAGINTLSPAAPAPVEPEGADIAPQPAEVEHEVAGIQRY